MAISECSSDVCSSDLVQLVHPAFLLGDVLDHDVGRGPVGAQQWKIPLEHSAVGGLRQPVAHGNPRSLVAAGFVGNGKCDEIGGASCRERVCQYVWLSVEPVSLNKETKKSNEDN